MRKALIMLVGVLLGWTVMFICIQYILQSTNDPEGSKVKFTVSNPVTYSNHLEWTYDWRHYRGHAIILADSLGITLTEALASMSGDASDEECEFYHTMWYTNQ